MSEAANVLPPPGLSCNLNRIIIQTHQTEPTPSAGQLAVGLALPLHLPPAGLDFFLRASWGSLLRKTGAHGRSGTFTLEVSESNHLHILNETPLRQRSDQVGPGIFTQLSAGQLIYTNASFGTIY